MNQPKQSILTDHALLTLVNVVGDLSREVMVLRSLLAAKGVVNNAELDKANELAMKQNAPFREQFLRSLQKAQEFEETPSSDKTKLQ